MAFVNDAKWKTHFNRFVLAVCRLLVLAGINVVNKCKLYWFYKITSGVLNKWKKDHPVYYLYAHIITNSRRILYTYVPLKKKQQVGTVTGVIKSR